MTSNEIVLFQELGKMSINTEKNKIKNEWYLDRVEYTEQDNYDCLCGKQHIKKLCYLNNKNNNNTAIVGSDCVKKFLDNSEPDRIFDVLYRLKNDLNSSIPDSILDTELMTQLFSEKQINFLSDICKKRKLNDKQITYKQTLNLMFVKHFDKNFENNTDKKMIDKLIINDPDNDFILSLKKVLDNKKELSYKQRECLVKSYQKIK